MNKLRLIRIYELRGKIHPIEAALLDILDGINESFYSNYITYSKSYIIYFSYDTHKKIYLYHIYTKFGYSKEETKEIMKYLLEKHLEITINDIE